MKINFRVLVVTAAVIATFLILLSSCNTLKKKEDNAYRFFRENPGKLAVVCKDAFPNTQKTVQGKNTIVTKHDTIIKPGIVIPCPVVTGHKRDSVKCPDQRIIYIDKLRVDTVYIENTARVADLQFKLAAETELKIKAETEETEANKTTKKYKIIAIIEGIILAGLVFLYFKK